jgi:diacylglycerol O-acyltransferase
MRQLTAEDANYLYMENNRVYGHLTGLLLVDPSTAHSRFDARLLKEYVAGRLHRLPPLRSRLYEVPYGIDLPYWIDDYDLDLTYHIRDTAVAPPGTDEQLAELVARLAARHLDRTRPLWEMHAIHGLEGGRTAILLKIHHAVIDGVSGMRLWQDLLDRSPEGDEVPPPPSPAERERIPTPEELYWRGWTSAVKRQQDMLQHAASYFWPFASLPSHWPHAARQNLENSGAADHADLPSRPIQPRVTTPAPRTRFNNLVTPHRRWAFRSFSLDEVKAVKNAAGVTVNDVVVTVAASAIRRWLLDRDELPDDPLLVMVPLSVRGADSTGSEAVMGNQVVPMVAPLPTDVDNMRDRLAAAHESMRAAKEEYKALPARTLQDVRPFTAAAAAQLTARNAADLHTVDYLNPPYNLVVSNVPGPREDLYIAGAKIIGHFPFNIIADGMGLSITVQGHVDHLDFGVVSCRELVEDPWTIVDYLEDALHELTSVFVDAEEPSPKE